MANEAPQLEVPLPGTKAVMPTTAKVAATPSEAPVVKEIPSIADVAGCIDPVQLGKWEQEYPQLATTVAMRRGELEKEGVKAAETPQIVASGVETPNVIADAVLVAPHGGKTVTAAFESPDAAAAFAAVETHKHPQHDHKADHHKPDHKPGHHHDAGQQPQQEQKSKVYVAPRPTGPRSLT